MTSKRMLLGLGDTGLRPKRPNVVQFVAARAAVALPSFPVATTVGNILVWIEITRSGTGQAVALDQESWTDLVGHGVETLRNDSTNPNAMTAYGATVTVARTAYSRTLNRSTGVLYEIEGTSLTGLTVLDLSDQSFNSTHDLGSLGTISTDRVAIMMIGTGRDLDVSWTVTPGVWTSDFIASRDSDAVSSNTFFGHNFPFSWHGHTRGTGAAVQARITTDLSDIWGGIVILFA